MSRVCICKIRQRKWICIAFNQLNEYVYVQLSLLCMPSIHILYSPLFYNILLQAKTVKRLMISDQTYLLQFQQGVGYKQDCPIKLSPHGLVPVHRCACTIITTTQNVLELFLYCFHKDIKVMIFYCLEVRERKHGLFAHSLLLYRYCTAHRCETQRHIVNTCHCNAA